MFLLDLVVISNVLSLGQQVNLLQSWERMAGKDNVRRLRHLREMNCPGTVALWTAVVKEAGAGDLEPQLHAHQISDTALDSGGKKATRRDIRLFLNYLLVAGVEEIASDTEAEGQSSSDSESCD